MVTAWSLSRGRGDGGAGDAGDAGLDEGRGALEGEAVVLVEVLEQRGEGGLEAEPVLGEGVEAGGSALDQPGAAVAGVVDAADPAGLVEPGDDAGHRRLGDADPLGELAEAGGGGGAQLGERRPDGSGLRAEPGRAARPAREPREGGGGGGETHGGTGIGHEKKYSTPM
nr:hypothetical protein [Rathayibacter sp. AY1C3]